MPSRKPWMGDGLGPFLPRMSAKAAGFRMYSPELLARRDVIKNWHTDESLMGLIDRVPTYQTGVQQIVFGCSDSVRQSDE